MAIKLAALTDRYSKETIALFQKGHKRAFEQLYDQFAPLLFSVILRIVEDRKNAETALSEAFIRIWKQKESYSGEEGCFTIWLLRFARETAFSFTTDKTKALVADFDWQQDGVDCASKLLDMMLIFGKSPDEVCNLYNIPKEVLSAKLNQLFKTAIQKSK